MVRKHNNLNPETRRNKETDKTSCPLFDFSSSQGLDYIMLRPRNLSASCTSLRLKLIEKSEQRNWFDSFPHPQLFVRWLSQSANRSSGTTYVVCWTLNGDVPLYLDGPLLRRKRKTERKKKRCLDRIRSIIRCGGPICTTRWHADKSSGRGHPSAYQGRGPLPYIVTSRLNIRAYFNKVNVKKNKQKNLSFWMLSKLRTIKFAATFCLESVLMHGMQYLRAIVLIWSHENGKF